jgi:cell division protein FtsB
LRNKNMKRLNSDLIARLFIFLFLFWPMTASSEIQDSSIEALSRDVQAMQAQAVQLDEENQGLRNMLRDMDDDDLYLVVDTESNRLEMRKGSTILLTAKAGTGSRQLVKEDRGRSWYFESPMGTLTVLGRERNPVWIRPDWSYVEENMPVPPENDPDRLVRGVLGKYALLLGNGYKIHGTKYTHLLGTHFTHGCVSLGDDDLDTVYKSAVIGTKVYIY